jgi:hypothetical protein
MQAAMHAKYRIVILLSGAQSVPQSTVGGIRGRCGSFGRVGGLLGPTGGLPPGILMHMQWYDQGVEMHTRSTSPFARHDLSQSAV